jgi:LPXTG-site transpeptidase (sortase) family protein
MTVFRSRLKGNTKRRSVTMLKLKYLLVLGLMMALFAAIGSYNPVSALAPPSLGTAGNFAVLAGSTATNSGPSVLTSNLAVWPGTAITGFPPGVVNGVTHNGDAVAEQAQGDLTAAYLDLAGRPCDVDLSGTDLGGLTLTEGVYCFSDSAGLTGQLTLDAAGNGDASFIFQIGSTLTTATSSSVVIINDGNACNVFWQVGTSATLGVSTSFPGNILALTSITLNTNTNITGRALARNGAVTMDTNDISAAVCQSETPVPPGPTETPSPPGPTETPAPPGPTETPAPPGPTETPAPPGPTETPAPPSPTETPAPVPTATPAATLPAVASLPNTGGLAAIQTDSLFTAYAAPLLGPQVANQTLMPTWSSSAPAELTARVVAMPFALQFPSLKVSLPLSSVGVTAANVMDVPRGSVNDPSWQTAFWYRGSSLPGEGGTMTVAGHVTDLLGQPGAFARLNDLRAGDLVVVHDLVNGRDIEYIVTTIEIYTPQQSADPLIIEQVHGSGPTPFGRAYLTLITCAGEFVDGSFVNRLVVYAEQVVTEPVGLYKPQ